MGLGTRTLTNNKIIMTITEILTLISERTNTQNTTTSSYPTTSKTRDINLAMDNYFILANQFAGNWRPADDTNLSDYPIVYADIVSGQQDLSFTVDEDGNQILDIYKIRIKGATSGEWTTLNQIDQNEITDAQLSTLNSGIPTEYYLTANGIFLVQKPNFSLADGLEIWVNRTPYHFTAGDVSTGTKVAGIPWTHHEYLALRPSYLYCLQKGLPQASDYRVQLFGLDGRGGMEDMIKKYYSNRNRAVKRRLSAKQENNK